MRPAPPPRPILPFRVHFEDDRLPPFDIEACDTAEVRDRMKTLRPGQPINKIKRNRENG